MKIHWKNKKIESKVLRYARDNRLTAKRLISIEAANDFLDLVPKSEGRAHFLKDTCKNLFSIDLENQGSE